MSQNQLQKHILKFVIECHEMLDFKAILIFFKYHFLSAIEYYIIYVQKSVPNITLNIWYT